MEYFLIMDVEASCNDKGLLPVVPVEAMETIQVGFVLVNLELMTTTSTFESLIKPQRLDYITPFCSELTGITKDMLVTAPDFEEAMALFDSWLNCFTHKKVPWGSWGWYDCDQIKRDCVRNSSPALNHAVVVEGLGLHVNLKKMFSKQKRWTARGRYARKQMGLHGALQFCDMEFEGRQHSALDDAQNVARLAFANHLTINEREVELYSKRVIDK